MGYAPASIISYVCAISYVHKFRSLYDPTSSFIVQRLLAAVNKVSPQSDTRLPITLHILSDLVSALQHINIGPYYIVLLRAMFLVAFYGLFRIGEITAESDSQVVLRFGQWSFHNEHAIIIMTNFKHNAGRQPFQIVLTKQIDLNLCPVRALVQYISFRGTSQGPLFCFPGFRPVSRNFFNNKLTTLLTYCGLQHSLYKSHSFRIGAASYYAAAGLSDEQIRLLGRWKSTAFRRYIRCERILNSLPE